jgi:hypothetical protein
VTIELLVVMAVIRVFVVVIIVLVVVMVNYVKIELLVVMVFVVVMMSDFSSSANSVIGAVNDKRIAMARTVVVFVAINSPRNKKYYL